MDSGSSPPVVNPDMAAVVLDLEADVTRWQRLAAALEGEWAQAEANVRRWLHAEADRIEADRDDLYASALRYAAHAISRGEHRRG